jgi:hypothetical protein
VTDSEGAASSDGADSQAELAGAVLAILGDDEAAAHERVTEFVRILDRSVYDAFLADRYHGIESQILARAVVAVGRPLWEQKPAATIAATIAAAQAYVQAPDDETWVAYATCATSSYPFGSGDGHYGVEDSCEPGSGCITGAGTLLHVADEVGFDVVIAALITELVPWLRTFS